MSSHRGALRGHKRDVAESGRTWTRRRGVGQQPWQLATGSLRVNDQSLTPAVSSLRAALGGSAITAVAGLEAGRRAARHTDRAELAARRLEAYANLLVAAGDVLGTYRRNLDARVLVDA